MPIPVRLWRRLWPFVVTLTMVTSAKASDLSTHGNIRVRPLSVRSAPAKDRMFTLLPPEQTGILADNRYDDPAMWAGKFREFSYGAIGTGVAIGDYDGDDLPDIFIVSKTGPNRLFRNLGGFRFEDVTSRASVGGPADAWQQGVAFADINNDGWLDLYVCRFDAPNLLYLNRGDGTFVERGTQLGLDIRDASGMAAFCDYNRDGRLDVYVQTNIRDATRHPEGERDYLFRQRADGTFENVTDRAGIIGATQGHSATWWDYDNDGWPDLYVANDYGTPDQLYHNNGDGTFTGIPGLILPRIPWFSMGSDLGDVNNDGLIDLFVAEMAPTGRERDQRGMLDVRVMATKESTGTGVAPQQMRNMLFLNAGTGLCLEASYLAGLAATDWTWSARLEDLDNDGRVDVHVTNGMVRDFFDADLKSKQETAETTEARERMVVSAPELREQHLVFRNRGDLIFEDASHTWGLDEVGISFGAAFGDLDGDGDLDIVYANYNGHPTVARNDSAAGHRLLVELRGAFSNRYGVGAMVRIETPSGTQVRQLVLARGYLSTSEPVLHFGLGDDSVVKRLTIAWPSGHVQAFDNISAGQRYRIKEPDAQPPPPARAAPAGAVSRAGLFGEVGRPLGLVLNSREPVVDELATQPLLPLRRNRFGPGVAVADLNGDGADDVIVGGATGERPQVMVRGATGVYQPVSTPLNDSTLATADAAPVIFDADGDGKNDLFLPQGGVAAPADSAAYQPQLFRGIGNGAFEAMPDGTLPALSISAGPACAADFNRDQQLDLFVGGRNVPGAYPQSPRSALLVNQEDRFVDVTDKLAPGLARVGMVSAALWSDVDQDGWVDLVIAVEWGGIRCWRNEAGEGFRDWTERLGFTSAGSGWWNSLAAADFNGDGHLDYAAGNLGLNTPYQAPADQPAVLFHGRFGNARANQIIEAHYEGGVLYPRRGRRQLGAVIPSVLRRFPANGPYAAAPLERVISRVELDAADRFVATEFRSGILLSQSDATYHFEALPRMAQIAPINGLVAGDFDGDGKADLGAVQNSYAPIPEVGRFDGGLGLVLRGNGHGGFDVMAPWASGLMVPGDAKGMAVSDFDGNGWPDFLITRNNDFSLAYLNRGAAGRNCFWVSLRGPQGNPTAVGARITVEMTDGQRQVAEVAAGGGYLSQSSARSFFGYVAANPPRKIMVSWPSGDSTVEAWSASKKEFLLNAPAN
jgi:hypothetical protein